MSFSIAHGMKGDLVDEQRQSRGFALVYTLSSAAPIAGPVAFGLVSDGFGLETALVAMAVVVALLAPFALLLRGPLRALHLADARSP